VRRSGRAATTHRRRDPSPVGRAGVAAGRGSRCRAGLVKLAAASPSPRSSLPLATTPTTPKSAAVVLEVVSQRDGWSGMMRGHDDTNHGRATGPRRALGRHPAALAAQAAPSQRRPALDRGPGGAGRDHLCPAGRGALAAAPREGVGLWQRRDLLAAAARLAAGRRVGAAAPSAAGLAGRRRPGRLVPGRD